MAKRQVFYSFHFKNDFWRVWQVRNMGVIEGNEPVSANDWEDVKKKGDNSIKKWIEDNMNYRSCIVVLIGTDTSSRQWVKYEISKAWKDGRGIVGIYIHGLKDILGKQCEIGGNPFKMFCIDKTFNYIIEHSKPADTNEINLSDLCVAHDTPYSSSQYVYDYIKANIEDWIDEALKIRNKYPK